MEGIVLLIMAFQGGGWAAGILEYWGSSLELPCLAAT